MWAVDDTIFFEDVKLKKRNQIELTDTAMNILFQNHPVSSWVAEKLSAT